MARQVVSVFGLGSMGLGVACSALAGGMMFSVLI